MTRRRVSTAREPQADATIWLDHDEAAILGRAPGEPERFGALARDLDESVDEFEHRALAEVLEEDRIVVTGPAYSRTEFERAYLALTQRPERLTDVEPGAGPEPPPRAAPGVLPGVGAVI